MITFYHSLMHWWAHRHCKHPRTGEVFRDYQDRFIELKCLDCGKSIFEDL